MAKKMTKVQIRAMHAKKGQTARGKAQDQRQTANNTLPATKANVAKWNRAPGKMDIEGVDTKKDKEFYEMTKNEFLGGFKNPNARKLADDLSTHRHIVWGSVYDRKQVPKKVLDNYPGIKKEVAKRKAEDIGRKQREFSERSAKEYKHDSEKLKRIRLENTKRLDEERKRESARENLYKRPLKEYTKGWRGTDKGLLEYNHRKSAIDAIRVGKKVPEHIYVSYPYLRGIKIRQAR